MEIFIYNFTFVVILYKSVIKNVSTLILKRLRFMCLYLAFKHFSTLSCCAVEMSHTNATILM